MMKIWDWMYWNVFWEIKEWFIDWFWNLGTLFCILAILLITLVCGALIIDGLYHPNPEYITEVANGKLISIRATGSFCIYDTELKFEDGSMLLVTYSFSRYYKLKIGNSYKIWYSSKSGRHCKLLGDN